MPQNCGHVPVVSVVMPVYNAERFLRQAVDSILAQTYRDFELLVINDGSSDSSLEILHSYSDPRLRLISNETNKGLIAALNRGIDEARGEYIARMDADDISHPKRLERQVEFLKCNSTIAMVGTWINIVDREGRTLDKMEYPSENKGIQENLLENACFAHPSVMFRKICVVSVGGYRVIAKHAEDYDLWLRLSEVFPLANIPELLLDYRIHDDQICLLKVVKQYKSALRCKKLAVNRRPALGIDVNDLEGKHPNWWQRLRGDRGSLGEIYIYWAELYQTMGQLRTARKLAYRALFHSPLSRNAHLCVLKTIFSHNQLKVLRWYMHRLESFTRGIYRRLVGNHKTNW